MRGRRRTKEISGYVVVGALGALLDFSVFFLLSAYGLSLTVSQWLAAFLGFLHNHLWHHFTVFEHDQRLRHTFTLSIAAALAGVAVSPLLLLLIFKLIGSFLISKIILAALTAVVLFAVRRQWVFTLSEKRTNVPS